MKQRLIGFSGRPVTPDVSSAAANKKPPFVVWRLQDPLASCNLPEHDTQHHSLPRVCNSRLPRKRQDMAGPVEKKKGQIFVWQVRKEKKKEKAGKKNAIENPILKPML